MGKVILFPSDEVLFQSKKKILTIEECQKITVLKMVKEIFESLVNDYDIEVKVPLRDVSIILDSFYEYYKEKEITGYFVETMIGHFEDIGIDANEEDAVLDHDFLLRELRLYELLDSRIEVNPEETKVFVKKLQEDFRKGDYDEG